MLRKLIKYDFRSTGRYIIPMYLMLIFIAILTRVVSNLSIFDRMLSFVPITIKITYEIILAGVIVLTYVVQAVRYYTNMVTDEGYITFTLPVKTSYLTISKLVTAVCWNLTSILLALTSVGIVFYSKDNKEAAISIIKTQFDSLKSSLGLNSFVIAVLLFLLLIVIFILYNLFIYTSIALGQILSANNKLASAFLAGVIIYMAMQVLMMIVLVPAILLLKIDIMNDSGSTMTLFIIICSIFQVLICGLMYKIINHIFISRLNLE